MISYLNFVFLATLGGKVAVVAVFVLLIVLLINLPKSVCRMLDEDQMAWWKRTRVWAVVIAVVQACVYFLFG
ncbi:MAG: hypothetical protein HOH33_12730 [Verrucomicrobia bacterium]|jgi:hypothetical protein|nr:hypothetical protein [Verrucomicrobiota bacterium]